MQVADPQSEEGQQATEKVHGCQQHQLPGADGEREHNQGYDDVRCAEPPGSLLREMQAPYSLQNDTCSARNPWKTIPNPCTPIRSGRPMSPISTNTGRTLP